MQKTAFFPETKERLAFFPTSISKVYLRSKPGVWPTISPDTVDLFYLRAKEYAKYESQIKDLKGKLLPLRKEIVRVIKSNKEVYGLSSEKDNFDLLVIPRMRTTWNRELLKKSLGVAYPGVVTEQELRLNILVPIELKPEMIIEAMKEALVKLGISEKDLKNLMSSEMNINVDEKRLNELLRHPRGFKLRAGTKQEEIIWAVKVEPFKKRT